MTTIWKTRNDGVRQRFHISPLREDIVKLYKEGMSSRKIGEKLNISHARVLQLLGKEGIQRRSITKPIRNPDYKRLTPTRAYLLGVMCGDGCVFSGLERKRKWTYKSYIVHLSVKDKDFIDEFVKCVDSVYGFEPRIYYRERKEKKWSNIWIARMKRKLVYEDLSAYNFGGNSWKVPEEIMRCSDEAIIGRFLRGFYDSEGSVVTGKRSTTITLCSTNKKGLSDIKELVERLGISTSHIAENKSINRKCKCFYFYITHRDNYVMFLNKIGFSINRKSIKVKEYLRGLHGKIKFADPSGADIAVGNV